MSRDIPTPEERERLRTIAERLKALSPDRQEAFEAWLGREFAKAKKPKRGRGRPKLDDPKAASFTFRLTPRMLREMETAAERMRLANVGEYLRWLHERFIDALGIKRSLDGGES